MTIQAHLLRQVNRNILKKTTTNPHASPMFRACAFNSSQPLTKDGSEVTKDRWENTKVEDNQPSREAGDVIKKVKQGQRGNAADAAVIPPTPVEQETDFEIAGELVGGAYRTTKNIKNGKKYNTGQFAMKNDAFEGRPIVSNDNLSFDHGKDPKETGTGHLSK